MSINYKNDDSFFTVIVPIGSPYHVWDIFKWFLNDPIAKFRAIRDHEAEEKKFTLKEINDFYPGIKTTALVMNPWARAVYNYKDILSRPEDYRERVKSLYPSMDLSSFDKFVISNSKLNIPQQSHWLVNGSNKAEYLLRVENINEDFKPIQDYFFSTTPLGKDDYIVEYKDHYSSKTKRIIEESFAEDIENFKYTF